MSKKIKLYIPVKMTTGKLLLINAKNCTTISEEIPSQSQIFRHLQNQVKKKALGSEYSSIKVYSIKERFEKMKKEISQKVGGGFQSPIIDLVTEVGTLPLIQIMQQKDIK